MNWKENLWKVFKPQMYVHSDNRKVERSIELLLSPYILHKVSGAGFADFVANMVPPRGAILVSIGKM